jgi:hypothetical protein
MVCCVEVPTISRRDPACLYYTACSPNSKSMYLQSEKGKERGAWTGYTLLAIILPGSSAQTSHLFRVLHVLLGFTTIGKKPHYSFIASPKIPWDRRWPTLWIMIPDPRIDGRLLVALDDDVNPKTAKKNQSPYPWAQLVVPSVWLRRKAHGAVCYLHCHAENAHVPYSGDVGISTCAVGCAVYFRPQPVCYPDQNGKTGWNSNV